jgi:hypothetical protein
MGFKPDNAGSWSRPRRVIAEVGRIAPNAEENHALRTQGCRSGTAFWDWPQSESNFQIARKIATVRPKFVVHPGNPGDRIDTVTVTIPSRYRNGPRDLKRFVLDLFQLRLRPNLQRKRIANSVGIKRDRYRNANLQAQNRQGKCLGFRSIAAAASVVASTVAAVKEIRAFASFTTLAYMQVAEPNLGSPWW